jgi:hypothetical protein
MGLLPFSLHGAAKDKVVDFNYPQDVSKNALADLENALKSGDGRLVVDAIVRYSIAQSGISEENMGNIVSRIESTLQQEKRPEYRALLNYFEACVFREYHLRYGVWDRENPDEDVEADDISTWDDASFGKKINELQCAALSQPEELKRHPITEFEGIIRYDGQGALLVPTLYQFLCLQCGNDSVVGNLWRQSVMDNIPAYIYACLRTGGNAEKLYKQFKDNEHCGLALRETYVDEDLYAAYKDYVARFPESIYTRSIENKIAELERRHAHLEYEEVLHSSDSVKVTINSRNVNRLTVTIYRVPDNLVNRDREGTRLQVKQLQPVQTRMVNEQGTIPFNAPERTITFDPLPYGQYVILPTYEVDGVKQAEQDVSRSQTLTVTDITLFSVTEPRGKNRVFAVDHKTGAPIAEVKIEGAKASGITGADGSIIVPDRVERDNFYASRGNDRYHRGLNYYKYEPGDNSHVSVQLFTDLGIYRPGETVKVATILYYHDNVSRIIKSNTPIQIQLSDTNDEGVDTISGITDAYGRFEGEFKLPTDRMNGQWELTVYSGENYERYTGTYNINVSEYKTPTFAVTFPDAKPSYMHKRPVKIEGKAETYSGMPVANAEVKLTLRQQQWTWWWRQYSTRNQGEVISDTTVTTDAEGKFSIEFADTLFTENQEHCKWARFNYALQAQVTDGAGETQETSHTFIVGTRRGISMSDEITHEGNAPITLPLKYNSTNENDALVPCTWELTELDTKKVVATGNLNTDHPVLDLSSIPSGQYRLKVHILDADEDEEDVDAEATLTLYRKSDKQAPIKDTTLWMDLSANHIDKNNKGHILVGTSAKEAHIYYIASDRKGVVSEGWLHYSPGLHDFVLDVPTDRENYLDVQLVSYHNGEFTSKTEHLVSPAATDSLHIRVTSFRDRLVPGKTERWTFQLTGKNESRRQGAMLLSMTDKAINDISPNDWRFYAYLFSSTWFDINRIHIYNDNSTYLTWQGQIISERGWGIPELYTYNQELFGLLGRGHMLFKMVRGMVAEEDAAAGGVMMDAEVAYGAAPKMNTARRSAMVDSKEAVELERAADEGEAMQRLGNIKLREADVKTALWMPMLTSDKDGNVSVEFEAPEFNTTWILQAVGYDKDLYGDNLKREVVTQKPIMVKSSLPRFVRQGDQVSLSANLQNATDQATVVDAIIELFDPRSGEVYTQQNYHHTLDARGTEAVSIDWTVPEEATFVGFRVKAANEDFGDGEQVMVPVLQAIQPVIETQPFYIEASAPQFSLQVPQSARDARVTLEYCNNPIWYCVTALPTIFDEHCVTASSLVHSLFAIEVAQGVASVQPQVREAINYWKANAQDSTLVSMLAKNQDLKIGTLLASPWVREADRQTLRMSRLDELFDTPKMAKERQRIVTSLKELQMSNGGFTWFRYPSCTSSYYTTSEVLELIGEIQHLGYLKDNAEVNQMLQRALSYYDKETLEQYRERKNKKDYSGFSTFVYIRSLFPTVKMSRDVQSLFDGALKQMSKDWSKGLSLGEKAYFALALNRNGYQKTARDITESIRQFAITKPALGTYWDNLQVSWRYFDKVAVTSTILQALNECDPRQQEIDSVRKWMLLMKQTNDWGSSSLAADAVYSLLSTGSQWLERNTPAQVTIGGKPLQLDKMDEYLGYFRKTIDAQPGDEISIHRNGNNPAWGAVYCQFKAPMTDIPAVAIDELSVSKDYSVVGTDGKLTPATTFRVGDRVRVRTVIKCNRDLDFVTLVDERASCFEPVDKLSGYRSADRTWYYHETKDSQTRLFFSDLQKGTHVMTYDVYVTAPGTYSAGIASIQCQYAPQIAAHSAGQRLTVASK